MNKQEAKRISISSTLSIGQLRQYIADARGRPWQSRVNSEFAMAQVCEIYERALAGRDDAEVPDGVRYNVYKHRNEPSKDSLIIYNILRDCA